MTIRWRVLGVVLYQAWPVGVAIIVAILAAFIGCALSIALSTNDSAAVRYAGTLLELSGLITVALGLRDTLRQFGQPPVARRVWHWFGALLQAFRRPEPIILSAEMKASGRAGGRGRLTVSAGPGASLEQRVELLERHAEELEAELEKEYREVRELIGGIEKSLRKEGDERRRADDRITRQVEGVAMGGFHLEAVGLFWLGLGLLGANIPDEIARVLSFVCW
jgi:hypothetical protein